MAHNVPDINSIGGLLKQWLRVRRSWPWNQGYLNAVQPEQKGQRRQTSRP